eukprot:7887732-Pyramimonas_sp.AAC.1
MVKRFFSGTVQTSSLARRSWHCVARAVVWHLVPAMLRRRAGFRFGYGCEFSSLGNGLAHAGWR